MTDLPTPSELNGDAVFHEERSVDARTFRASTLDEAVALARAELGPDVELVQASRVRRGGLGGFFATDLGVEVLVRRTDAIVGVDAGNAARDDRFATVAAPDLTDTVGSLTPAMEISSDFGRVMAAADRELGASIESQMESRSPELAMAGMASMQSGAHSDGDHHSSSSDESWYGGVGATPAVNSAHPTGVSVAGRDEPSGPMGPIGTMSTELHSSAPADSTEFGELDDTTDLPEPDDLGGRLGYFEQRQGSATSGVDDVIVGEPERVGDLPMTAAEASVQTALDRLIEHAESIDRPIPPADAHAASSRSAVSRATIPMPMGTHRPMLPADDFWNPREVAETFEQTFEEPDDAAPSEGDVEVLDAAVIEAEELDTDVLDTEELVTEELDTDVLDAEVIEAEPGAVEVSEEDASPTTSTALDRLTELEDQLRADLAAMPTRSELSESPASDPDDTIELPRPVGARFDDEQDVEAAELLDQSIETELMDEQLMASTEPSTSSELAPPSALLNPQLAEASTAENELDAMLRSVGIDVDVARLGGDSIERLSSTIQLATDVGQPTAAELAEVAQQRLVDGVASLSAGANAPVMMLAVTITGADGTSVSMSTQLAEDDDFLLNDALMGASAPNLQLVPDFDD